MKLEITANRERNLIDLNSIFSVLLTSAQIAYPMELVSEEKFIILAYSYLQVSIKDRLSAAQHSAALAFLTPVE